MIKAVIFDLDGVLVSTDDLHYRAWKKMADSEGIPFDRQDNERLRGVSRMASLDIILEKAEKRYTDDDKRRLADQKNEIYKQLLNDLTPQDKLPGAQDALERLKSAGVLVAIGSSSRNAPAILEALGWLDGFDAVSDGNQITHSKPDPEVFLLAAQLLGVSPNECLVVEDAVSGVEAALSARMKVLAVGSAASDERATYRAATLADCDILSMLDR